MTQKLARVRFAGQSLVTIKDHDDIIYVAMRPIVEGMGLAWKPQFSKLQDRKDEFSTVTLRVTRETDQKQSEMVSIPLKKLPGWLFSVNRNNIPNPAVREAVARYQEESYDVLYNYWFNPDALDQRRLFPEILQDALPPAFYDATTAWRIYVFNSGTTAFLTRGAFVREVRAGRITGHTDERGHWMVDVPSFEDWLRRRRLRVGGAR